MRRAGTRRRRTERDRQREATRSRLLDAARELFAEHGYYGVSTSEIARAAGVTHGTIHAHFHAKAGLLFELIGESNRIQTEAATEIARGSGTLQERLARIVDVYLAHDLADRELLSVMQAYSWEWPNEYEERNRRQLAAALAPVRDLIEEGIAAGRLRCDVSVDRKLEILFGIYTRCLRMAIFDEITIEDCAVEVQAQFALVFEGLRAPGQGVSDRL